MSPLLMNSIELKWLPSLLPLCRLDFGENLVVDKTAEILEKSIDNKLCRQGERLTVVDVARCPA